MALIAYVIIALGIWAHPTNTVTPNNYGWIVPFHGNPNGGVADAWPDHGICHVRVNRQFDTWPEDVKIYVMTHEVGHCLGLWDPGDFHSGDGIMGGGAALTAYDQFRIDALHPSPIVRRTVIPMISY